MKYAEQSEGHEYSVAYTYNDKNQLAAVMEIVDGHDRESTYEYDEDGRITFFEKVLARRRYNYDAFGRVSSTQTLGRDYAEIFKTTYTYNDTASSVSGQVSSLTHDGPQYDVTYSYTYDDNGNILSVTEIIPRTQFDNLEDLLPDESFDTTLLPPIQHPVSYVYDSANQLIRENNQAGSFTHTWTYDNAGNILQRKEYAYATGSLEGVTPTDTVTYTYGDSEWGDLLTACDGNTITYDQIGNPLTDGTWTYTWQHGRQLASMTDGSTTWNYTYNADGIRTKKTNGTTTYNYVYDGGLLKEMTVGTNTLKFTYDASGTPLTVTYNGTLFYYITNLQGDVVTIINTSRKPVVSYTYDAWGNILTLTGTLATTLGQYNPLTYRGYVYDYETGLYYLQSRYYNPQTGRFLNADGLVATGQGLLGNNMFAYCGNNPVMYIDPTGYSFISDVVDAFMHAVKVLLVDILTIRGFSDEEKEFLSVVAGEAVGGTTQEQKAVAHTIMNRLAEPRDKWSDVKTVSDVLTKNAYNAVDSTEYKKCKHYLNNRGRNDTTYEALIYNVMPIYYGWELDFTGGAHFIFNIAGSQSLLNDLKQQPNRYQICGPFEDVDPYAYCMYRCLW